jgi:HEPN domain-containing protein
MDLESAKHLLGMKPIPYEVICYHCQQSAEKSLKALMVKNQLEVRKIHDLVILIQDVLESEPGLKPVRLITSVFGQTLSCPCGVAA